MQSHGQFARETGSEGPSRRFRGTQQGKLKALGLSLKEGGTKLLRSSVPLCPSPREWGVEWACPVLT